MKKSVKVTSLTLVCMLIIAVFGGTSAFAESVKFISFYPTGNRTIDVDEQDYFQVLSSATEAPTVKVSDTSKLKVEFDKRVGVNASLNTYQYKYKGIKAGNVTVSLTSKDGMTAKETFTVKAVSDSSKNIIIKSDTTGTLSLKQGSSYTLKINCATKGGKATKPVVTAGDSKIVKVEYLKHNGSNYYYKITAIGKVGQSTGVYTSATGVKAARQVNVIITSAAKPTPIDTGKHKVKCDTTIEFNLKKGASYTFKITSPKEFVPIFAIGTKGIFSFELVKKSGDEYFYKITAIGTTGQSAGVYTTIPDQDPIRHCKVLIA